MKVDRMISCIVGAGYSSVAGDPLTSQLFRAPAAAASKEASQRFDSVRRDFETWVKDNPTRNAEEYLGDLYSGKRYLPERGSAQFEWAVELIGATFATSSAHIPGVGGRYSARITRPSHCLPHVEFWRTVLETRDSVAVITTNYDFRVEQVLRHRPMKRPPMPGFYYGGLPRPQILQGTSMPFTITNQQRYVELTGTIPLFKIHGSLNWSLDFGRLKVFEDDRPGAFNVPHFVSDLPSDRLKLYQDMRPAFRHVGDAAIVPPLPFKRIPKWLASVWEESAAAIKASTAWIVCGYSLPSYDASVVKMLQNAATRVTQIYLLSPHSVDQRQRWLSLVPDAEITPLRGLPEGTRDLRKALRYAKT